MATSDDRFILQAAKQAAKEAAAKQTENKKPATPGPTYVGGTLVQPPTQNLNRTVEDQAIIDQMNSIVAGVSAGAKAGDQQRDSTKAEQQQLITDNTKLSAQLGASIDSKTGKITPPTGGYTAASLAEASKNPIVKPTIPGPALSTLDATQLDAYSILEKAFRDYGLDELVPVIEGYMKNNIGPQQASLLLRQNEVYKQRFAGNYDPKFGRVAQGLNAIDEATYLELENSYNETLNSYGLNNYFGATAKEKRAGLANIIGGSVSATEFQNRVQLAEDEVINADPEILKALKYYYNIDDKDVMKYYLDPAKHLPELKLKTQAAQIDVAAAAQGFTRSSPTSSMDLAIKGVTQQDAIKGYINIGQELPIANKLNQIYSKQSQGNYDQATAEAEQFNLKGAASAARKKRELQELEKAQFSGRSGIIGANVNSGYSGSLGKSLQGKF